MFSLLPQKRQAADCSVGRTAPKGSRRDGPRICARGLQRAFPKAPPSHARLPAQALRRLFDEIAVRQGISYTFVAAALTLLQIIRIINVAAMRGMGDVRSPRIMATICVLIVNPAVAFTLTSVFSCGVWGIWIASMTTQVCWFVMSCVKERRCMQRVLRLEAA